MVVSIELLRRTTCPHCWHSFAPEDVLWISGHADLRGDPRLGADHSQRFLPTRFTPDGTAIDAKGFACTSLACPNCHLFIPRAMLEMEPFFVSILGTPSCGKSFFLATLTWTLRKSLPAEFGLSFSDADPTANLVLTEYEKSLFLNPDADRPQPLANLIRKTELQGELYDAVSFGSQTVSYPRPFMFTVRPLSHHPNYHAGNRAARVLCVYDNAGEHCLPGQESVATPATNHMARARVLLFLFDPLQDPRFRERCRFQSKIGADRVTNRQESVLAEAAARIRRFTGLAHGAKHDRPLIVVVTKADYWSHLIDQNDEQESWRRNGRIAGLDMERINRQSGVTRDLLANTCPEIVSTAEQFAGRVLYIPVSALGTAPTNHESSGRPTLCPRDIRPWWVTAPFLVSLREGVPGLVSRIKSRTVGDGIATTGNQDVHTGTKR